MDVVLHALNESVCGYYINNSCAGSLTYTDDLILVSVSLCGLQVVKCLF